MRIIRCVVFLLSLSAYYFAGTSPILAQTVPVLGEMRTTGRVLIEESKGKWFTAMPTYPLLEDTNIKTEGGTVSFFLKDGSRIDLGKDTTAVVGGSAGNYIISLSKGLLAFNVSSLSSCSISTPSAAISMSREKNLLQKVSSEKAERVLGVISVSEKGTEVRTISGKLHVSISRSESILVSAGEGIIVGAERIPRIYKTQAVTSKSADVDKAGEVTGLKGTSNFIRSERRLLANLHDSVLLTDKIETAKESRIKLYFIDDSRLTLGEKTRLSVEQYLRGNEKQKGRSIFRLTDGMVRALVGKNSLEIHTPTAVAAARGTEFIVYTTTIDNKPATCVVGIADEAETWNSDLSIPGRQKVREGEFTCVVLGMPPWNTAPLPGDQFAAMMQMTSIAEYAEAGVGPLMAPGGAFAAGTIVSGDVIAAGAVVFSTGAMIAVGSFTGSDGDHRFASPSGFMFR